MRLLGRRKARRFDDVTLYDPCGPVHDARALARSLRDEARARALGWGGRQV